MKALAGFTVRAHPPERLAALETLSINFPWSGDASTQELFAPIDSESWQPLGRDPVTGGGLDVDTPLPVAGSAGYAVRVLPHHRLLAADDELGLVTLG